MPLTRTMHLYHLLKVANTQVERNSLKSTIIVESHHLRILVDKPWHLRSGSVGISWSQCLRPLQNSVWDFCKGSHSFPMGGFLCCSVNRAKPLVRDRHTQSHRQTHSRAHVTQRHTNGTDSHAQRQTCVDIGANRFTRQSSSRHRFKQQTNRGQGTQRAWSREFKSRCTLG